MKLAIMQPYFFPYVGYFELIAAVDKFVILDDVQFVKGWTNRNRIRSKDKDFQWITVPLQKHSRSILIRDLKIDRSDWICLNLKRFVHTYGGKIIDHPLYKYFQSLKFDCLSEMLEDTLRWTCDYLGIKHNFVRQSVAAKGQDRLIEICHKMQASCYVNLSGGIGLYDYESFRQAGIELQFMAATMFPNKLSIIDVIFGGQIKENGWGQYLKPI